MAAVGYSAVSMASVTGSFTTHISFTPLMVYPIDYYNPGTTEADSFKEYMDKLVTPGTTKGYVEKLQSAWGVLDGADAVVPYLEQAIGSALEGQTPSSTLQTTIKGYLDTTGTIPEAIDEWNDNIPLIIGVLKDIGNSSYFKSLPGYNTLVIKKDKLIGILYNLPTGLTLASCTPSDTWWAAGTDAADALKSCKTSIISFYNEIEKLAKDGYNEFYYNFSTLWTDFNSELPGAPRQEEMGFLIDWEAHLVLSVVLSGLTVTSDSHIGIAGPEDATFTLSTTLGALDLTDTFIFATPYERNYWGHNLYKSYIPLGGLLFVSKDVVAEITLGGLTFSGEFFLADVNFPNPGTAYTGSPHTYTSSDQTFRFGTILTMSGTTVSGIGISSETGICVWDTAAHPASSYPTGIKAKKVSWRKPCENPKLEFSYETITLSDIEIAGVTLGDVAKFYMSPGGSATSKYIFKNTLSMEWVIGITTIDASIYTSDLLTVAGVSGASVTFAFSDYLSLQIDLDSTFAISGYEFVGTTSFDDLTIEGTIDLGVDDPTTAVNEGGISSIEVDVTYGTLLEVDTTFSNPSVGGVTQYGKVKWASTDFTVTATAGDLSFSLTSGFSTAGLDSSVIEVGVSF